MRSTLGWMTAVMMGCRVAAALGIGAAAPTFNLGATDGKTYDFSKELKGAEAAVVVFVATKCPYSNAYNKRYNELAEALKKLPKKVAFFAINSNVTEPMDDVKKHATENKFNFPVLKDEGSKIADGYTAERTPEAYVIDKTGKVVYHGRIDDDSEGTAVKRKDLFAAAEEVISGKKVSVAETKAFGCSIKRN